MMSRPPSFEEFTVRMEDPRSCALMRDFVAQLANPVRLKILCRLVHEGPMCVGEIVKSIHEKQSTVSQQLKQLQMARFVSRTRRGNRVFYSIGDAVVEETMMFLARIAPAVGRFGGDEKSWL